jgi:hypothetical protein
MNTNSNQIFSKPVTNFNRQGGWSFWSLMFTLSVVVFFSYIGMQLVPLYSGNTNIEKAMTGSVEGQDLRKINRAQIIRKMNQQLYLDSSHKILNYKTDLVIKRTRSELTIQTVYNRQIPITSNMSLVVAFDNKLECDLTGKCTKK